MDKSTRGFWARGPVEIGVLYLCVVGHGSGLVSCSPEAWLPERRAAIWTLAGSALTKASLTLAWDCRYTSGLITAELRSDVKGYNGKADIQSA